jgi:hypothetical protein
VRERIDLDTVQLAPRLEIVIAQRMVPLLDDDHDLA